MRLTKTNYFTNKNQYLSSSKIKDFVKDPYYFFLRHVTGEIEFQPTPSMKIGSAVDLYLTGSRAEFNRIYAEKVYKKDNPDAYQFQQDNIHPDNILAPKEFERIQEITARVKKLSVFREIKHEFKAQRILKHDQKIGLFDGLAGIPDWYKVDGKTGIIVDLKTTQSANKHKFYYACRDYEYYLQQAVYQMLLHYTHPEIENYKSYILAVETSRPYITGFFKLDQDEINKQKVMLVNILEEIGGYKKKDFKPNDITWELAEKL